MKKWNNPKISELGIESTLGNNKQFNPEADGTFLCASCGRVLVRYEGDHCRICKRAGSENGLGESIVAMS